jgi:hypothetical protein
MTTTNASPVSIMESRDIELQLNQSARDADVQQDHAINQDTALTRQNLLKVIAASMSFFFAGNNDGSLGALTPYILRTYSVGTEYVALM